MYGVFSTDKDGNMKWLATLDNLQSAIEVMNETQLGSEQTVMILQLHGFFQNAE